MVYRTRIKYTAAQKAEIWDRWQRGEPLTAIGRLFDRPSTSISNMLAPMGGIRPPPRQRSRLALTLAEREEVSRGITRDVSLRAIAARLGRAPSTIRRAGIEHAGPSPVNWSSTVHGPISLRRSSDEAGRQSRSPAG